MSETIELRDRSVDQAHHGGHVGGHELARAYVPMQGFTEMSSPAAGLRDGTIFPVLLRPYTPKRGGR